ncbi:MAG: acyltransferase [Clostridia bacterium]|nr:acyltransferase [Clostridia bacterium]
MTAVVPKAKVLQPPDERRVGVLDGVRTILIFLVGSFHIWQQSWLTPSAVLFGKYFWSMDPLLRSGYIWVDGMILLSGFLLFLTYGDRPMDRKGALRFYKKRFARIYPSYALNVLVFFFLNLSKYPNTGRALWDLAAHLTFSHTFWYFTYYGSPINGALWTVGVEVQFYLLFPLILYLFRKKPGWTFAVLCAAAWVFRYWASTLRDCGMAFNQLPAFLDVYALGMAGAEGYRVLRGKLVRRGGYEKAFFLFCAVLSLLLLYRLVRDQASRGSQEMIRLGQMTNRLPLALALTVLMVSLAFTFEGVRWLLSNRVMAFLSSVTFQFYMYHQVLAVLIKQWRWVPSVNENPNMAGEWPWQPIYTAVCFLVPLLLSVVLTYGFEKPVARLILGRGKSADNAGKAFSPTPESPAEKADENKGVDAT